MAAARYLVFAKRVGSSWGPGSGNRCQPPSQPMAAFVERFRALNTCHSSLSQQSIVRRIVDGANATGPHCRSPSLPSKASSLSKVLRTQPGIASSSSCLSGSRLVIDVLSGRAKCANRRAITSAAAAYMPADAGGGAEGDAPKVLRPQVRCHGTLWCPNAPTGHIRSFMCQCDRDVKY